MDHFGLNLDRAAIMIDPVMLTLDQPQQRRGHRCSDHLQHTRERVAAFCREFNWESAFQYAHEISRGCPHSNLDREIRLVMKEMCDHHEHLQAESFAQREIEVFEWLAYELHQKGCFEEIQGMKERNQRGSDFIMKGVIRSKVERLDFEGGMTDLHAIQNQAVQFKGIEVLISGMKRVQQLERALPFIPLFSGESQKVLIQKIVDAACSIGRYELGRSACENTLDAELFHRLQGYITKMEAGVLKVHLTTHGGKFKISTWI